MYVDSLIATTNICLIDDLEKCIFVSNSQFLYIYIFFCGEIKMGGKNVIITYGVLKDHGASILRRSRFPKGPGI